MDSATRPTQDGLTEAVEAGRNGDRERVPGLTAADLITDQAVEQRDDDALDYMAFVQELALLVARADCPVNIALFGPWGSGKSTVGNLLRAEIASNARRDRVAMPFVRYDAWRFAGLSLQRSFISEAAEELGINRERYHRSLYQDRRTGGFRLRTLLRSLPVGLVTFALALAGIIALATGLVALAAVVGGKEVGAELKRQAPTLLPVAGLIALFTAIARPFLDAASVQVSEGAPVAAEQFRLTFTRLIKDGLRRARRITVKIGPFNNVWVWPLRRFRRRRDRVVFFIDELDRCSPEDVVEALRALKTFLEVNDCAFLVAADRDVLEAALDRLPQTTPLNEEAPYFSSAGSFLDKVFQYQIPLPLLRGGRRVRIYARTLVRKPKEGLWWEIHDNGRLLDDIVYTLIPSHVRSPRRVKVLLNKFAVNARIAGAHGIVWMERAEEIAKLTVLQTEFPAVAADLRREPRLPELLLHPPRAPSPIVGELLERHDVGAGRDSGAIGSRAQATSRLLAGAGRAGMVDAQRGELRRYLERTATVPDARRDLLFLETGGRTVGLADAQLMDEIETMAPSAPDQVADHLSGLRSERQRLLAAEVLLDMSERAVGREKRNIITLLVQTVDGLPNEATQVADRVTTAVRIFSDTYDLPHELLAPALRISALQQVRFPVELTNVLREGGLWSERKTVLSVLEVAALTGQLERIESSIATSVRRWPDIVAEAIRDPQAEEEEGLVAAPLPWEAVDAILGLEGVAQALSDAIDERAELDEQAAWELAEELYAAGTRSLSQGEVSVTAIPLLAHIRSRIVYGVVRDASERLDPHPGTPEARCGQALAALRHPHCDPRDWAHWQRGLEESDSKGDRDGRWAVEAMGAVLERFRGLKRKADQEAASDMITALAGLAEVAMDAEAQARLVAAAETAIASSWWDGPTKLKVHGRLHAAIRALTLADPVASAPKREQSFASRLWQLLEDDLRTALRNVDAPSHELLDAVRDLAAELPAEYSARLSDDMERVATSAIDVELATRFGAWLEAGLEQIGADEETIAEVKERADIERLKTVLDPARFASIEARLEPLIARPPDAEAVAQVAIELSQSLGAAGTRFSRLLLQSIAAVDREALDKATRAAEEHGSGPDQRLRSVVDQAAGGSLLDRPGAIRDVAGLRVATPGSVVADRLTAEVVIVGSGAAGGVLAHRLAKAGRSVLILERGEPVDPATTSDRSALVRQALGDTRRAASLEVLQAQCVGGSTLIGDGIPAPLPRSVLDRWDSIGGPPKELALGKTIDRLAVELDLRMPKKVRYEVEGADEPLEGRELTLPAADSAPDRLSMLATFLPRAQQVPGPGKVDVLSDCRVERVRAAGRRIRRVDCRLGDGRTLKVEADIVVLAAGAIQSSAILRRSRLGGEAVGKNLHFNLTALLLAEYEALEQADEVRYFESMDQGYVCVTRAADDRGPVAGMPGWFEDIAQGRRGEGAWTVSAVTIGSTGTGEVHVPEEGRSRSRFVFRPGDDIERLAKALRHVGAEAFRNDARRVRPATPQRQLDIRRSTLDDLVRHVAEPGDLMLTSGQPLGGNPMGLQARGGVVDENFRVHGTDNLYVCDASVIPTPTTVYPQLSVMALADSAASRLLAPPDEAARIGPRLPRVRRRAVEPASRKAEKGRRR